MVLVFRQLILDARSVELITAEVTTIQQDITAVMKFQVFDFQICANVIFCLLQLDLQTSEIGVTSALNGFNSLMRSLNDLNQTQMVKGINKVKTMTNHNNDFEFVRLLWEAAFDFSSQIRIANFADARAGDKKQTELAFSILFTKADDEEYEDPISEIKHKINMLAKAKDYAIILDRNWTNQIAWGR